MSYETNQIDTVRFIHPWGSRSAHPNLPGWEAIAEYMANTGHMISVINPYQIKSFANSCLARSKTDKIDARCPVSRRTPSRSLAGSDGKRTEPEGVRPEVRRPASHARAGIESGGSNHKRNCPEAVGLTGIVPLRHQSWDAGRACNPSDRVQTRTQGCIASVQAQAPICHCLF